MISYSGHTDCTDLFYRGAHTHTHDVGAVAKPLKCLWREEWVNEFCSEVCKHPTAVRGTEIHPRGLRLMFNCWHYSEGRERPAVFDDFHSVNMSARTDIRLQT